MWGGHMSAGAAAVGDIMSVLRWAAADPGVPTVLTGERGAALVGVSGRRGVFRVTRLYRAYHGGIFNQVVETCGRCRIGRWERAWGSGASTLPRQGLVQ
ncbi:hypothetical protein CTZ28_13725 [Streptomyces shenzhenensis]|uniref:Uncharacterized protein n=1 Tax=Streptomyces shenzhenensis TaxID=943815 RepID=A0A3M0I8P2_9ACTN|nr:hypothetical protein CTZ28_13725 [Streptomyces shenzhenensis]